MKLLLATIAITVFLGCSEEVTRTNSPEQSKPKPDTLLVGDTLIATRCDTTYNNTHRNLKIYKNLHKKTIGGSGLWQNFKSTAQSFSDAKSGDCILLSDSESVWFVPDSTSIFLFKADTTCYDPKANWKKLEPKSE
jgi:hypothetical protein